MRKKPVIIGLALAAVGLAATGWFVHKTLLARYYVRQLAKTPESDADACVARVARLGQAAVPRLLDVFGEDAPGCVNAGKALAKIVDGFSETEASDLVAQLPTGFGRFSPAGRRSALGLVEPLLNRRAACKDLVLAGLKDGAPANRECAVVLAMRKDIGFAAAVVPLMNDAEAEVRRGGAGPGGGTAEVGVGGDIFPWGDGTGPRWCVGGAAAPLPRGSA